MILKPFKVHSPDGKSFYRDESNPATVYAAPQPVQTAQSADTAAQAAGFADFQSALNWIAGHQCDCCGPATSAVMLDDERAAPTSEYFVYDPSGGHVEFYETDAQRAEAHAEAIAEYRKESISDGEWSLDVECIVSGVVTHKTASVNDDGETCDYEARAASPQPGNT